MKLTNTQKNYRKQINKAIKEGKITDEYGSKLNKPIKWGKTHTSDNLEAKVRSLLPFIAWLILMYSLFRRFGGIEGITQIIQSLGK